MNKIFTFLLFLFFLPLSSAKADYLDTVRNRGYLVCGVTDYLNGLSYLDEYGEFSGLYPDVCRFVAAAVLGSKDLVEFIPIIERDKAVEILKLHEIDVILSPIAATVMQILEHKIINTTPVFYDTKQIMVHPEDSQKTVKDMVDSGKIFCYTKGNPASFELARYVKRKVSSLNIIEYNTYSQLISAFTKRKCDALYEEYSVLKAISNYSGIESYHITPEVITYSVIPPLIVASDKRWSNIMIWAINLLIAAEDKGINKEKALREGRDAVFRQLNLDKVLVEKAGFSLDFAYNAISQVGNYDDIYNRTVFKELKIKRGMNDLAIKGGSLYSPSF